MSNVKGGFFVYLVLFAANNSISIIAKKTYLGYSTTAKIMPIKFGRFTDAFKPKAKTDAWSKSEKLFEQKQYMDSYDAFLNYIKDDALNNVSWKRENNHINFELQQGSKTIRGSINENKITAWSDIAEFEKLSVAFMRRLMEMNYTLYYTRFALKDNGIYLKFDSGVQDGHPRKLYYALKELAIRADKQDDLLLDDFSTLKPVDNGGIEQIPAQEKEIKYTFFSKWIEETLKRASELNEDSFSGAISYLLLDLLYRIDYLITPEGTLMNDLEKMSWTYFAKDSKPFPEKNRKMKEDFAKLLEKTKEAVIEDLYRTKSTFGIANPSKHDAVVGTINSNIDNVKWYIDNNYEDIPLIIYEYIGGYCLFNHGLAKPAIKLFDLQYRITRADYFNALGIKEKYYDDTAKKFDEQEIKKRISEIIKEGNEQFPELKFNAENLKFDSMVNFLKSYITEIQNLNFNS